MENKYLEKIAGFGETLGRVAGRYAKHLTGETVRETKRAAKLHKSMEATSKAADSMHSSFKATMGRNSGPKGPSNSFHNRDFKFQAKKNGLDQMKSTVEKDIPHTTDDHVLSAMKTRDTVRKGTALTAGVATGAMYSGARRRAEKENEYQYKYAGLNMSNKYLEKVAAMTLGPIARRAVTGAAVGGVTGAVIGGKDNRIKGALAGATAGGVAGSLIGRAIKPKVSNVFDAGSKIGRDAKLVNPGMGGRQ